MAQRTKSHLLLPALLGLLAAGCAGAPAPSAEAGASEAPRLDAGWLLLGRTENASLYIDPRSTLRVGSSAFIMVVAANNRLMVLPDGATVGSLRERYEIDCAKHRYRRFDGTAHADQAALGPVLGRVGQDPWKGIVPRTVIDAVSNAVCAETAAPDESRPLPGPLRRPRGLERVRTFRT